LRPELCPGLHWGAYSDPPDPLAGLRDPNSGGVKGKKKGRKEGKERNGMDPPPFHKFLDPLLNIKVSWTSWLTIVESSPTKWLPINHRSGRESQPAKD